MRTSDDETARSERPQWRGDMGVHVTDAIWCDDTCAFALGDGSVLFANGDGEQTRVDVHDGACLAAARLNGEIVTSGDDGKVASTDPTGETTIHFNEFGRFIDQLATAPWGGIAFSDARRIYVVMPDGSRREYRAASSVGGLAFSPRGRKLAASRNNGASVYWIGTERETPDDYEWKGAHGPITWSPNGDFIVTSMQENALHIWRLDRKKHGRIGGYPSRIKSLDWDKRDKSLATSGADGVVIWPFAGESGPIGQSVEQLPVKENALINTLCFHPTGNVIAVGLTDGDVTLVNRANGALHPVALDLGSPVTALAFKSNGFALAFGTDEGSVGVVDTSDIS